MVIAGGVESMTMVPMTGNKLSASPEAMRRCPDVYTPMGITAENVAKKFGISRADQDAFALRSQQKAAAALKANVFDPEIVPVKATRYEGGKRVEVEFKRDELPRGDTTLEGLAALKPSFAKDGSVTPGNASPLSDGAAAALVMSKAKASSLGVTPLAYFRGIRDRGVDPALMGIGPIPAVRKLPADDRPLAPRHRHHRAQRGVREPGLGTCSATLEIPEEKLNVHGGAIALGHPLGCTGAKLTATALYELRRRGGRYAIVTMCIGGGQGAAGLLELAR